MNAGRLLAWGLLWFNVGNHAPAAAVGVAVLWGSVELGRWTLVGLRRRRRVWRDEPVMLRPFDWRRD